MCEEDISQLAVALRFEYVHGRRAHSQPFMCIDAVEINGSNVMAKGRNVDHSAWGTFLSTVQKQIGQQEWTDVIDTKD